MDLSSVVITIDTREKDRQRINAVETAFRNNKASTVIKKCEYVDYVITGYYRGEEINIGIEYKTFDDFIMNRDKLPDRLYHALETYDTVALFVELDPGMSYNTDDDTMTLVSPTDFVVRVKHPNIGHIVTTTLAEYENMVASFTKWGVECRTIYFIPKQIPYSMFALIRHVTKGYHTGVKLKYRKDSDNSEAIFKNMIVQVPGVGVGSANKLIAFGLTSIKDIVETDKEVLERVLGKKKGTNVYVGVR